MYNLYDVNKLDYIRVLNYNKDALAYLNKEEDKYIDLTSNTVISSHNERIYKVENTKKICDFTEIISKYNLWILLIDVGGNIKTEINQPKASEILSLFRNISRLNKEFADKMYKLANEVAQICSKKIDIYDSEFTELLKSFIFIDMMLNGKGYKSLVIIKFDNFIDYKIKRLINYLNKEIDINSITDFKIEYSLENIRIYNKDNRLIEVKGSTEKEKTKILI